MLFEGFCRDLFGAGHVVVIPLQDEEKLQHNIHIAPLLLKRC